MQEIVNRVLEAERQAEKTVQEARSRAAEIRRKADEESEARVQKAREQAQSLLQDSLAKARAQAAREQQEAKAESESRSSRFLEEHGDALEAAADAIVSLLATPEHDRKNPRERRRTAAGD